jgi:NAD(P)-dependent dehydrogenase (short-subunit alcohol dehydrogenase family)
VSEKAIPERLSGRVAVVTGAATGIGRAIAARLRAEGAAVAVLDLDRERGEAVAAELGGADGRALYVEADVSDRLAVEAALARVEADLGPLEIVVNNAGIAALEPFLETSEELWTKTLAVNLSGVFVVGQEAGRRMAPRGRGAIVNICSTAARTAHTGTSAYTASKAGVEGLTRSMAVELAPLGIAVNAVAPGAILGGETQDILNDEERAARLSRYPAGRMGDPEDIAAVVAFLASDDAAFLRGAIVPADGGYLVAGVIK